MQVYKYTIPAVPPSLNEFLGKNNIWNYQKQKKKWATLISLCCKPKPNKPLKKAIVTIRYYFPNKTRHDPDNYSGKFINDGLTKAGILVDDSFKNIKLQLQGFCDEKKPRTEIIIEECQNFNE